MTDKQREICEDLGWEVCEDEGIVELRQYSPLGEDFGFSVSADSFITDLIDYYNDFDPEEHAVMWFNARHNVRDVPQSIRVLLRDADKIDEMIEDLCSALCNPENEEDN